MKLVTSRRAVLASFAGGALQTAMPAKAASSARSLLCIRFTDRVDADAMIDPGSGRIVFTGAGERYALSASFAEVQRLYEQRVSALIHETNSGQHERGYILGGLAAPAWMLRVASEGANNPSDHIFQLPDGLLLLTPKSLPAIVGDSSEVAVIPALASDFAFPETAIGRQLRQAANLLATYGQASLLMVATLGGSVTVGDASVQRAERLRQLSTALAAFYDVLSRLGLAQQVVVFTEADDPSGTHSDPPRLLLGANVLGGEIYSLGAGRQQVAAALAEWVGFPSGEILPAATPPAQRFLY